MIIGQDALNQLECESLVQVLELEKVWLFRVREETQVFDDRERVQGGRR